MTDQEDKNSEMDRAREKVMELLQRDNRISEVKGAGKSLDIQPKDSTNREYGKRSFIRSSWSKGDTTESNESFKADTPVIVNSMSDEGLLDLKGTQVVIYDHGEGKGEREYAVWFRYTINTEKINEYTEEELELLFDPAEHVYPAVNNNE